MHIILIFPITLWDYQAVRLSSCRTNDRIPIRKIFVCLFVCLFVCSEFIVPLKIFSLILKRNHCRWRTAKFDLCSDNGHLRGPVTLTTVAECLAVELSLPVFTTEVCCNLGSSPISRMRGEHSTLRHRGGWKEQ